MTPDILTKKPVVSLFSSTYNPLQTIALAIDVWHSEIPAKPISFLDSDEMDSVREKFRWLLKQPHQTPLEYFSTVWVLKNFSRAFQQQLTRHRVGFSYSIQSLRVVDVGKFADEGRFYLPAKVKDKISYHKSMTDIQNQYNEMIVSGMAVEDARGILPLNIHSTITMSCSYRALLGLLRQRMCVAAQDEWSYFVDGVYRELEALSPIFVEPLDCACGRMKHRKGFCKTLHKEVKGNG